MLCCGFTSQIMASSGYKRSSPASLAFSQFLSVHGSQDLNKPWLATHTLMGSFLPASSGPLAGSFIFTSSGRRAISQRAASCRTTLASDITPDLTSNQPENHILPVEQAPHQQVSNTARRANQFLGLLSISLNTLPCL